MLLTEIVTVKWHNLTKQHYINKGYIFTKFGDEFEVKFEDLSVGNEAVLNVKCDNVNCANPYLEVKRGNYLKCLKPDGRYYCRACAKILYGGKNTRNTKLTYGKSFEQWCIENNRQDVLDRWDYDLNNCKPSDIAYATNKKYYFKCPKEIHKSELKSISNFTNGQEGTIYCKACSSFAQWGVDNLGEDFLEKYWDYDNIESILQKELSEVVVI